MSIYIHLILLDMHNLLHNYQHRKPGARNLQINKYLIKTTTAMILQTNANDNRFNDNLVDICNST